MNRRHFSSLSLALFVAGLSACAQPQESAPAKADPMPTPEPMSHDASNEESPASDSAQLEVATLGAGCYWCVEAVYEQIEGVRSVTSGFMGGAVNDPSYEAVCSGQTGHAEVVQVSFDPSVLPYSELLDWFWRLHNPTTLNRQGADTGTQYRSAIFVHSAAQREVAEASLAAADTSGVFDDPIVTEITDAEEFWEAKQDHQDYYQQNKSGRYCQLVIRPKLSKLGLKE